MQIVGDEVMQQVLHLHKDAVIVGGGGEDQRAAAEGLGHDLIGGGDGGVVHPDGHALFGQTRGQNVGGVLGVAVDGGVGQQDALLLRLIAAPKLVLLHEAPEVLPPDKAVERADRFHLQRGGLLQHRLHLRAVFAHNVGVVAPGLIQVLGKEIGLVGEEAAVQRAESAEGVGGEENAVRAVVAHHDLGPVHHGRHHKVQLMPAGGERVTLLDQLHPRVPVTGEKLREHGLDFGIADDGHFRMPQHQPLQRGGVVRLHMVDHKIVQRPAAQRGVDIFKELLIDGLVRRVEEHRLLVQKQIGVVGHAPGAGENTLEADQTPIVGADPDQIFLNLTCAIHINSLLCVQ